MLLFPPIMPPLLCPFFPVMHTEIQDPLRTKEYVRIKSRLGLLRKIKNKKFGVREMQIIRGQDRKYQH